MKLDEILEKLSQHSGISKEELLNKVKQKQEELAGLISLEGAAHLVAHDLGLELPKPEIKRLKIANIVPGMKNVNILGRLFKISQLTEFERADGSMGKVVNLYLGDESGWIRLPLWDRQTALVEEERVRVGDVLEIRGGIAYENIYGNAEIKLGRRGSIKISEESALPSVEELGKRLTSPSFEKAKIKDLVPGFFEIKAVIVHIFKANFLFDTCSICGATLEEAGCPEHGDVAPTSSLVVSGILDDGTGNIRFAIFRTSAEKLIETSATDLVSKNLEERYELITSKLLGKEFVWQGRVRKNRRFDRLELLVNEIKPINILEESRRLAEELESR